MFAGKVQPPRCQSLLEANKFLGQFSEAFQLCDLELRQAYCMN